MCLRVGSEVDTEAGSDADEDDLVSSQSPQYMWQGTAELDPLLPASLPGSLPESGRTQATHASATNVDVGHMIVPLGLLSGSAA